MTRLFPLVQHQQVQPIVQGRQAYLVEDDYQPVGIRVRLPQISLLLLSLDFFLLESNE